MKHYVYANVSPDDKHVEIGASTFDGKTQVPLDKVEEATAAYSLVEWRLNMLAGKILTLVDACIPDPAQKKAIKDLIRERFSDEFGFYAEHLLPKLMKDSVADIEARIDSGEINVNDLESVDIDQVIAPGK